MGSDRGQQRVPFGVPKDIVLLATPNGWRHSIRTEDGALVCGRLRDVPVGADTEQAKEGAAAMLRELGREFHGTVLEVAWGAAGPSGSWSGRIRQHPEPQHEETPHLTAGG